MPKRATALGECFDSALDGYPAQVEKGNPDTEQTDVGPDDSDSDVESDPAKDTDSGTDWSDEGGATPEGPSTDTE
jgi:hypothetical protein